MIRSMTAFARAAGRILDREVTVEIRSVNSRFRDVVVRLPKAYAPLEEAVKKAVAEHVARGRVEVWVQVDEPAWRAKSLKVNLELARAYHAVLVELKKELGLAGEVELSHLAGVRDIIVLEEEEVDLEGFGAGLASLLETALERLVQMRAAEGRALAADLSQRLETMRAAVEEVTARGPQAMAEVKTRLEEKIRALIEGQELDQNRLLQEVAYLAERSDITEELVRLKSHFSQFQAAVQAGGVVGRRLEFLLQETNREVNTIGSKSQDTDITTHVVDLKAEIEKLREQVQNVE